MPRILIVFGTTDGHTAKVAGALAAALRLGGATVDVFDARGVVRMRDDYAGVIVAASLHAGGYQKSVRKWVRAHAAALAGRPTAFVSVCLGILQKDPAVDRDLAALIEQFCAEATWQPTRTKIVAGALLYRRYTWLTRWWMKRIVAKAGGDTDTSRDYEYTDWDDVRAFAVEFSELVKRSSPSRAGVRVA